MASTQRMMRKIFNFRCLTNGRWDDYHGLRFSCSTSAKTNHSRIFSCIQHSLTNMQCAEVLSWPHYTSKADLQKGSFPETWIIADIACSYTSLFLNPQGKTWSTSYDFFKFVFGLCSSNLQLVQWTTAGSFDLVQRQTETLHSQEDKNCVDKRKQYIFFPTLMVQDYPCHPTSDLIFMCG